MKRPAPTMIVSGVPYRVTEVEGHEPVALSEFAGDLTMTTQGPTGEHQVSGAAEQAHDGAVRVHEKDHDGAGKDVRVWTVAPAADHDGFTAAG